MVRVTSTKNSPANGSHLGFEATFWTASNKLRGNLLVLWAIAMTGYVVAYLIIGLRDISR